MGLGPWFLGFYTRAIARTTRVHRWPLRTNGVHRPTVLAPQGGPDGTPPYWGGGRFVANLLVNLLVSLVNVLVII